MFLFNSVALVLLLFAVSCGGSGGGGGYGGKVGAVKAMVLNSKSFNPSISHGQIAQYVVTISGEGIDEPIVAVFDGGAESGLIEGVPAGEDRILKVEAINLNSVKMREGDTPGVEVKPGETAEAVVSMEAVPIFANLADGNVIPNTRFIAKVFSDPNDPVIVDDEFDGGARPLMDVSIGTTEVLAAESTGLAVFNPPLLSAGEHQLTARSVMTGRATTVKVLITDGGKAKPAPLYNAGSTAPARLGGFFKLFELF